MKKLREQLRVIVRIATFGIANVVSVVVVWLAPDWLVALHCSLFRFCLCSGALRFTVVSTAVAAPAVSPVQIPFLFLTACQIHLHHRQ